jgi:hypothetical protein
MNAGLGIALIAVGILLGLLTQFGLWRRLPGPAAILLLAVAGVVLGAGVLLVQEAAGAGDWAITLLVLGALTPLHGRLVFGPPGRSP